MAFTAPRSRLAPSQRVLAALFAAVLPAALASSTAAQVERPLPVVERLEPTSGAPLVEVILHGRHFDDAQTVHFGPGQAEVVSRSPSRWTVRVPREATSGPLRIVTPRGEVRGPSFRVSAASAPPRVLSFEPAVGAPGTEVLLRGERFSPRVGENLVLLGERQLVVRSATPTELRVIAPATLAAPAPFRVRVTGVGEAISEAAFALGTGTTVIGFEPAVGPPGTRVVVRGSGFHRSRGRVRVALGDVPARVLRSTETELSVELPRRGAATGLLRIEVQGGGRAFSAQPFTVREPPRVTSMEPLFGAPGTRVTLAGSGFGTDLRVVTATLGEQVLAVRDIADGRLVVEIPEGATSGPVSVTVGGLGPAGTREPLRVTERVSIADFAPRSGPPGTEVTITGVGFSTVLAHHTASLNGVPAEAVRAIATELVVRVPVGRSGLLLVAVANAGEARTMQPFVITSPPVVEGFAPQAGPIGAAITIRGQRFGSRPGLVRVHVGATEARVTSVSDTQILATIPEGTTTGPVRVTVRLEGSATTPTPFTVTAE